MDSIIEKHLEIKQAAEDLFASDPDWVTFYRAILGPKGVMRQHYRTMEALLEFKKTESYLAIQRMLAALRHNGPCPETPEEPNKIVTLRLPMSMHAALSAEAHDYRTSINKLCISKLLQFIENEMVPPDIRTKAKPKKGPEANM